VEKEVKVNTASDPHLLAGFNADQFAAEMRAQFAA
jgi:hypothetical protein